MRTRMNEPRSESASDRVFYSSSSSSPFDDLSVWPAKVAMR